MRPRLEEALFAPMDAAGLAAFRVVFGLVMAVSTTRFLAYGWVEELYVKPTFFFKYWGFAWVKPLPAAGMTALHVGLLLLSLCIAAGAFYRVCIVAFAVAFAYLQLLDVTNYLNHYYLVALLSVLLATMPLGYAYGVDAWRRPARRLTHLPAWQTYLLRLQVGAVYFFAGLAKANADWLLHAQPLGIWLSARTATPLIGPLLDEPVVAYFMSWAGFLFDTTIWAFLLWSRTRLLAYAVILFFHATTQLLFPIGMFPTIMVTSALVFFPPDWPRRAAAFLRRVVARSTTPAVEERAPAPRVIVAPPLPSAGRRRAILGVLAAFAAFTLLMPFRYRVYGGNVLWHEQGMRFSWRVMLREKNGSIHYYVEDPSTGRTVHVSPRQYLTDRQLRDFSSQPDLILQLARHIAEDFRRRGHGDVRVRAEALVSLNGRRPELLVDPTVDLAHTEDGLARYAWVRPAPSTDPIHLHPIAWAPRSASP